MPRSQARRITRPLSNEQRDRYRRIRQELEAEKPEIMADLRRLKAAEAALRDAFRSGHGG